MQMTAPLGAFRISILELVLDRTVYHASFTNSILSLLKGFKREPIQKGQVSTRPFFPHP